MSVFGREPSLQTWQLTARATEQRLTERRLKPNNVGHRVTGSCIAIFATLAIHLTAYHQHQLAAFTAFNAQSNAKCECIANRPTFARLHTFFIKKTNFQLNLLRYNIA